MAATLQEETDRIEAMVSTGRVAVTVLGHSLSGHPIRLLRVGDPPPAADDQAVLILTGAQHGNETAGREAILEWAEAMSVTTDPDDLALLQSHGVLAIPTCNPDGVELDQRQNLAGVDINRDHLELTQPESRAIAFALRDTHPALVVDLHGGNVAEDVQMLGPTHPQVDPVIVARSINVIDAIEIHLQQAGFTPGVWSGDGRETILRNNAGLRNLAGLVAEVDTDGTEQTEIDRSRAVIDAAFAYTRDNAAAMLADIQAAAENRAAVGAAANQPFDLRVAVLDPPPTGYQLSSAQQAATVVHRDLFGISGTLTVSMAQASQPLIPLLFDVDAAFAVVAADRLTASPEPPPPPPVAVASIRTRVTWYGCDVVTGAIIAELPDIRGEISRVLGAYTSAALEVPIPRTGPGHVPLPLLLQATELGRSMIVSVINDLPAWAGIVLTREGGTDASLRLGCVSLEGYLARREVGSHELVQVDEASIAATLAGDAGAIPDVGSGIGLTIDAASTGTLRDRIYEVADRAGVYDRLQELMAIESGPEWTIDLDWTDADRNAVAKILRIRDRIGVAASSPSAVFRTTAQSVFAATAGSEARYSYREDYSSGRGANHIIAYSSGEGEDQPTSAPAIGVEELAAGWPVYQRSWQPASNITTQAVLDAHAHAELDRLRSSVRTWQIDVRWDAYPRYGVDWQLGDDVAWDLKGHRHPDGVTGQGRAIGWALDIQAGRMKLILAEEG